MEHDFYTFYTPCDQRRDGDKEVACCRNCGVEIDRPQDLYPIIECPPVEMFTPEWCSLMSIMPDCDSQFVFEIHDS